MRWLWLVALAACGRIGFDPLSPGGGDDTGPAVRSSIGASLDTTCVIRADGTVWCWGEGRYGELGDGITHVPVAVPQQVPGLPKVVAIEAGWYHVCAITAEGALWCWGSNTYGQSGVADPFANAIVPPTRVSLPRPVLSVSAGGYHTCAVLDDNTVACWGKNTYGEVGHDPPEELGPFTIVTDQVTAVTAGKWHTCAIRAGNVVCWGNNSDGQLGNGTSSDSTVPVATGVNAVSVSATYDHTCAVEPTGRFRCWGANDAGQLGDGGFQNQNAPTAPSFSGITQLRTGYQHTCVVRDDNSVWCWGGASHGEQGYGGYSGNGIPRETLYTDISDLAAGLFFTCALKLDGSVQCSGQGSLGQLGDGKHAVWTPTKVPLPGPATLLAAGRHTVCAAVGTSADLYCWGSNEAGQINGSSQLAITVPTQLALSGLADLAVGDFHACALSGTALYCWGDNANGQLGLAASTPTPTRVSSVASAIEVVTGRAFTCVRDNTGMASCFGNDNVGQLGDGGGADSVAPVLLPRPSTDLSAGTNHACTIDAQRAYCWGDNSQGQSGNGRTQQVESPVAVAGMIDTDEIKAGGDKSCLIATNNDLYCWGYNGYGDLGTGDTVDRDAPALIASNIIKVDFALFAACAVTGTGTKCWGENAFGELADGTTTSHMTPTPAAQGVPSAFNRIDGGDFFFCGKTGPGDVYCWGDNEYGQIGNGQTSASLVPLTVAF
ncbi:MAG TPA: hypothetical protein VL326_08740 [Kofleriaceae bacterium]|nr:hypothetical protein [Kofleriaceae bacterium]